MSDQQAEEMIEALEPVEDAPKPKKRAAKKPAPVQGLSPATIRARAIVLGRLKS